MPVSLAKLDLPTRAPLTLKGFKAPKAYFWSRFNKFCRSAQAPQVTFQAVESDKANPDSAYLKVNGVRVATIERRPHDWFRIQALTGEAATLDAGDVDGVIMGIVLDGLSAGQAILRRLHADDFFSNL